MSEEEREIENLVDDFQTMSGRALRNIAWETKSCAAREALIDKIRSIIAERDALRQAMKSHRGE